MSDAVEFANLYRVVSALRELAGSDEIGALANLGEFAALIGPQGTTTEAQTELIHWLAAYQRTFRGLDRFQKTVELGATYSSAEWAQVLEALDNVLQPLREKLPALVQPAGATS